MECRNTPRRVSKGEFPVHSAACARDWPRTTSVSSVKDASASSGMEAPATQSVDHPRQQVAVAALSTCHVFELVTDFWDRGQHPDARCKAVSLGGESEAGSQVSAGGPPTNTHQGATNAFPREAGAINKCQWLPADNRCILVNCCNKAVGCSRVLVAKSSQPRLPRRTCSIRSANSA